MCVRARETNNHDNNNNRFLQTWSTLDPTQYYGSGRSSINRFAAIAYDVVLLYANAITALLKAGTGLSVYNLNPQLRVTNFTGITGSVVLDKYGDRISTLQYVNLGQYSVSNPASANFKVIGTWSQTNNSVYLTSAPVWNNGTTIVPDLDVRDPFDYWSCYDQVRRTDKTGYVVVEIGRAHV